MQILCPNTLKNANHIQNTDSSILIGNTVTNPNASFLQAEDEDDKPGQQLHSPDEPEAG